MEESKGDGGTPVFNKHASCCELHQSHDHTSIAIIANKTSLSDDLMLERRVPTPLILYFKYLKTLPFNAEPDYQYLRSLLESEIQIDLNQDQQH